MTDTPDTPQINHDITLVITIQDLIDRRRRIRNSFFWSFVVCIIIAFILAGGFAWYVTTKEAWTSTKLIHTGFILGFVGFSVPIFLKMSRETTLATEIGTYGAVSTADTIETIRPIVSHVEHLAGKVDETAEKVLDSLDPDTLERLVNLVDQVVDQVPKLREWLHREYPRARNVAERYIIYLLDQAIGNALGEDNGVRGANQA